MRRSSVVSLLVPLLMVALCAPSSVSAQASKPAPKPTPKKSAPKRSKKEIQAAKLEAQRVVDLARVTIDTMRRDPNFSTMRELLVQAKGIMIFPSQVKAGFIVGGELGTGILLERNRAGNWTYPAFYRLGGGSVGLQIGVEISEVVFLIMTDGGMKSLLSHRVKLGADLTVALGPVGAGVTAETTTNVGADIYSYSISKGVFGGISVDGAVLLPDEYRNEAYYGKKVTTIDITKKRAVKNSEADSLRRALAKIKAKPKPKPILIPKTKPKPKKP